MAKQKDIGVEDRMLILVRMIDHFNEGAYLLIILIVCFAKSICEVQSICSWVNLFIVYWDRATD